jgi:tripartite-type tricarboxylate transporter receptor subunit TctC
MEKAMNSLWRLTALVLSAGLLTGAASGVHAQGYPNKPIRIVVPYPPGGFNDTLARTVGQKLNEAWGQPVVVDNKPGAGTLIGTDAVAKASPDGYTLLITPFAFAVNPSIFKKLPYDPLKDFAPITLAAATPNLLVANASVPFNSLKELIASAKAKPGRLSYASTGTGSYMRSAFRWIISEGAPNLRSKHPGASMWTRTELVGSNLPEAPKETGFG